MLWQRLRLVLLAGVLVAGAKLPVQAQDGTKEDPKPAAAPAACTCTVRVMEWVPEKYECTRTVWKSECKEETYTAFKCECVAVERTRKVCCCVPTWEDRTYTQCCWSCKPVQKTIKVCCDKGHYECRCVPDCRKHCSFGHGHKRCGGGCGDRCQPCCECVPMKMVKCWVPCVTWEERTVCCMERVCEKKQVTCKVCVYKTVVKEEKCTVMETKKVPVQCKRTVRCCVPVQEKVTCCRMVCRCVEKQVACAPCCDCCCVPKCRKCNFGHGHKSCGGHGCKTTCCSSGCCN